MNTILTDVIPAKYRKYVYAALALAALVYSVYQASNGDWTQFVGGVFALLVGATATSNTDNPPPPGMARVTLAVPKTDSPEAVARKAVSAFTDAKRVADDPVADPPVSD